MSSNCVCNHTLDYSIIVLFLFLFCFVLFFFFNSSGRFYKPRLYGVPAKSVKTRTFSVANPGFEEEHHYSELFAEHHKYEKPSSQRKGPGHEVYKNSDVCLQNGDYQLLHVNLHPEPTYAALKTESKV